VFLLSPKSCTSPWSNSGEQSLDFGELTRGCCSSRRAQVTPVWLVPLTGLTGADPCWVLLGWTFGWVRCCPVWLLFRVWGCLELDRPVRCFGAFWLGPVWPVCFTGLTGVELFYGSRQVSPVGTGLTGGAHRPDRCRSARLESCVPLRYQVCEVGSWFLGPVALQWLRGLGRLE
jgi:hypothetical protein